MSTSDSFWCPTRTERRSWNNFLFFFQEAIPSTSSKSFSLFPHWLTMNQWHSRTIHSITSSTRSKRLDEKVLPIESFCHTNADFMDAAGVAPPLMTPEATLTASPRASSGGRGPAARTENRSPHRCQSVSGFVTVVNLFLFFLGGLSLCVCVFFFNFNQIRFFLDRSRNHLSQISGFFTRVESYATNYWIAFGPSVGFEMLSDHSKSSSCHFCDQVFRIDFAEPSSVEK